MFHSEAVVCLVSAPDEDLMLFKDSRMPSVEDGNDMSAAFAAPAVDRAGARSAFLCALPTYASYTMQERMITV